MRVFKVDYFDFSQKNSRHLKVAGNFPKILFTLVIQFFYMKNQNNQL